ncbi:MAG TPA: TonB-dependent receptor [Flavisolibacter sp.]
MKKAFGLSFMLGCFVMSFAQDTLMQKNMNEVFIYSSKFAERKKNIVQRVDIVSAQRIGQLNAQNTGDLLINTGNVFVQKSQQGGSSPVIRGFEASRVLLVIDGIRMNNAIYRAGHLQNIITVDQNMLERVEVLYGPASTLYGSDALGGVVHFRTKLPKLSTRGKAYFTGSAFTRYSSANNEKTAHFDLSMGGKKLAWLQSYNFSDFGDMKMGDNYSDEYPDFGRRTFYVDNINGIDSIVKNADDRIQKFSGYRQWDITQKFLFRPNDKISHLLNLQHSNSGNIPRYDRLQDIRNGTLRFAEWYYGPQLRNMAAYEINVKDAWVFSEARAILSYQHIEESRHQRDYRRYDRLDNRYEKLDVFSVTIDGRKLWKQHELTLGMDAQFNDVRSTAVRKNIQTGTTSPLDSRYPNGENRMNYYGVYAQHLLKFGKGKFVLNDGLRIQGNSLHSTIADNSFFHFPFTEMDQDNVAVTGNIGLVYMPSEKLRINGGFSTGFRAPNIDDMSRIFESNTASRQLIIPNPGIKPEYTYNFDLGISQAFAGKFKIEAGAFYTLFRNAIALSPFQLNGQDSVIYNGTMSKVFANLNVNRAYIYGLNANVQVDLSSSLYFTSTINYQLGRMRSVKNPGVPLDHIPPVFGKTALHFTHAIFSSELYALYNGWKKIMDYNPSGEDNAQYATPEGMPSWMTLNFKSTISLSKIFQVQLGVENILDRNYRYFASGFSAPGRNWIIALRSHF